MVLRLRFSHRAALLLQPPPQTGDLAGFGDGAAGELGKLGIDLRRCRLRDLRAASANGRSKWKPRCVDPAAEHPQHLLFGRQRRHATVQLTLSLDILLAVVAEPCSRARPGSRRVSPPGAASHMLMHQPFAGSVLAVRQLQHIGRSAQPRRQGERLTSPPWCSDGARAGRAESRSAAPVCAARLRFRRRRCARRPPSSDRARLRTTPAGMGSPARQPHLHGAVVDGIGRAQNFRRRVGRVLVHADLGQVGVAPGLVVAMQRMRDAGRGRAAVG